MEHSENRTCNGVKTEISEMVVSADYPERENYAPALTIEACRDRSAELTPTSSLENGKLDDYDFDLLKVKQEVETDDEYMQDDGANSDSAAGMSENCLASNVKQEVPEMVALAKEWQKSVNGNCRDDSTEKLNAAVISTSGCAPIQDATGCASESFGSLVKDKTCKKRCVEPGVSGTYKKIMPKGVVMVPILLVPLKSFTQKPSSSNQPLIKTSNSVVPNVMHFQNVRKSSSSSNQPLIKTSNSVVPNAMHFQNLCKSSTLIGNGSLCLRTVAFKYHYEKSSSNVIDRPDLLADSTCKNVHQDAKTNVSSSNIIPQSVHSTGTDIAQQRSASNWSSDGCTLTSFNGVKSCRDVQEHVPYDNRGAKRSCAENVPFGYKVPNTCITIDARKPEFARMLAVADKVAKEMKSCSDNNSPKLTITESTLPTLTSTLVTDLNNLTTVKKVKLSLTCFQHDESSLVTNSTLNSKASQLKKTAGNGLASSSSVIEMCTAPKNLSSETADIKMKPFLSSPHPFGQRRFDTILVKKVKLPGLQG